ncbi:MULTISPECIES: nitroreductase family protein [Fictibacillus]|uniref:Putative NAD(P)H nitroreductase n=1 Tax=Fictibacillus enclensis TaxID=1017270 RepID=A0A0V8JEK5_9BACL|nr:MULTISPECIES: nitroreductase [Fictibacillus]KSU85356.1 nitroreductase [Fictibacillus enclensis]RXY98978.1 nitroreductase [Fictibacillus sp. S7]SCB95455.1 Nitroreductase [Fictibacillus enclensis]
MDIFDAIKTRRSIGKVKDEPVPKEDLEKILEAGTYAPNHHRTNPWRFFVLTGEGRNRFGEHLASVSKLSMKEPLSEEDIQKLEKTKKKPLRAPVIIAVGVEPDDGLKIIREEEVAAVSAAIQNMLLAAHALGLGAVWRTGAICYHEKMKDFFQLSAKGEMAGFIYLGYPEINPTNMKKQHFNEVTQWIN